MCNLIPTIVLSIILIPPIGLLLYEKIVFRFKRIKTKYDGNEEFQEMQTRNADYTNERYLSFYEHVDKILDWNHRRYDNTHGLAIVGREIINAIFAEDKINFFEKYFNKKKEVENLPSSYLTEDNMGVVRHHILIDKKINLMPYIDLHKSTCQSVSIRCKELVLVESKKDDGEIAYTIESHKNSRKILTISEFLKLNSFRRYVDESVAANDKNIYELFLKDDVVMNPRSSY